MRAILIVLILSSNAFGESIYYQGDSYSTGNLVETSERDTTVSAEQFKMLQKTNPRDRIHGVVTSISSEGWFLLIRCVIKTNRPVRQVLASLDVEAYNPARATYRRAKSFNVAMTDTIPAKSVRTYVFRQHVSIIEAGNNRGLQMLWNWHLRYNNVGSFRWTFNERNVR